MSRLPTIGSDLTTWGSVLNDFLSVAHNGDGTLKNYFFNVKDAIYAGGAKGDSVTDDTAAIQAAITAASGGGIVFFPTGSYVVSATLALSNNNVRLMGCQQSTLYIAAVFSGINLINITGQTCGVMDLNIRGVSTTYSSNPAVDAIQISSSRGCSVRDVVCSYINGYGLQSTSGGSISNDNTNIENVHIFSSKAGFHILGNAGSGNDQVSYMTNCNCDFIQNGDCYFFEDAFDFVVTNIYGNCTAGSGNSIHIKGNCIAIYISNIDVGPYPGPSTGSIVLIESGPNGTPSKIGISNGIAEGGLNGVQITAGSLIKISNLDIFNNGTNGISVSGSSDAISIYGCQFSANGSNIAGSRYEINWSATGNGEVTACIFTTAQGTTTQKVNNVINATAGNLIVQGNRFEGTGFTTANVFNGFPALVLANPGYNNVLGNVAAPSITASPATINGYAYPVVAYIKGGTVSAIAVNGTATGLTLATGGFVSVLIPAGGSITLTYSVIPTWTWFAA